MHLRSFRHFLVAIAATVAVVSLLVLMWGFRMQQPRALVNVPLVVRAHHPARQAASGAAPLISQVVVGTPETYPATPSLQRYTYRNEFPTNPSKPRPLYLVDTQTGKESRLGDDTGSAFFDTQDEHYLLWYFGCGPSCTSLPYGLYAYAFATGQNIFISKVGGGFIRSKIASDWVALGDYKPKSPQAPLFAFNLQTHESITLTQELDAVGASVNGHFGISARLAAWYTFSYPDPSQIVIYDLAQHRIVATLTDFDSAFHEQGVEIYDLSPGETVVTWSRHYGYDLVTGSYFRIPSLHPPNWDYQPFSDISAITEQARTLYWTFQMQDGTQRSMKSSLFDATPSVASCAEGQNLVKNGNLEDIAAHNAWQQSDTPSDLIVNDLPPNSPQAGQWAIRLGRYSNSQPTIQQTLNIPSNVKHIQLAFDVRASSWDIWGGDQLQVDLIDPVTNQSILATPVQWSNRQLANGGWIPLQVEIQDWPGIDTPLQLVFRAQTDWAFPTDFTIDNIRLLTACH